jgi:hypothetical protein
MLELAFADWHKTLAGAEAEEFENLKKAYPPDPNDPLKAAFEARERAANGQCDRIERPRVGLKR